MSGTRPAARSAANSCDFQYQSSDSSRMFGWVLLNFSPKGDRVASVPPPVPWMRTVTGAAVTAAVAAAVGGVVGGAAAGPPQADKTTRAATTTASQDRSTCFMVTLLLDLRMGQNTSCDTARHPGTAAIPQWSVSPRDATGIRLPCGKPDLP